MARASSIPKLDPAAMPADLKLVILFGSQVKGSASPASDWDLGVLFMPGINDPLRDCRMDLPLAQALGVNSDAVDVVDLERGLTCCKGLWLKRDCLCLRGRLEALPALPPEPTGNGPTGPYAARGSTKARPAIRDTSQTGGDL